MEDDESGWVFDSLICFLNGPEWNAPLQSFIEEKSLIFEANLPDNEEHTKVYDEFKNLVDFMLGNFMEDLGITPQQFENACNRQNTDRIPIPFDQNLFELIWAANDYVMFKRMMCQRNVELQLQALELIERKYGITSQLFLPHDDNDDERQSDKSANFGDNKEMKVVSKARVNTPAIITEEDKILQEVVKSFPGPVASSSSTSSNMDEVQYLLQEKNMLENTLKAIGLPEKTTPEKFPLNNETTKIIEKNEVKQSVKPKAPSIHNEIKSKTKQQEQQPPAQKSRMGLMDKLPMKAEIDQLELKKRQEYLRAQRDKLVALKKDIRKKHLTVEQDSSEKMKKRPKSAKAAEALLAGSHIEPQQLELRKTLIERLKTEVIHNKDDN